MEEEFDSNIFFSKKSNSHLFIATVCFLRTGKFKESAGFQFLSFWLIFSINFFLFSNHMHIGKASFSCVFFKDFFSSSVSYLLQLYIIGIDKIIGQKVQQI